MDIARVIGTIWATAKDPNLQGSKMQLIQPLNFDLQKKGTPIAAIDTVGAGQGELVYYVTAYEAVIPMNKKMALADASIVGIIDRIDRA